MDIPVTQLTANDFTKRVNRVVELQRRWSSWIDPSLTRGEAAELKTAHHQVPTSSWENRCRAATPAMQPSGLSGSQTRTRPSSVRAQRTVPKEHHATMEESNTAEEIRWSEFGVAVHEIAALQGLCDSLRGLSTHLSVEVAIAALEAAARIFDAHPLIGYLLKLLATWLPKGIYANPIPLLMDAEPFQSVSESSFSTWLLTRSAQWSSTAVPLGTVSSVFDVGRKKCLSAESGMHRLQCLGNTLFGGESSSKKSQQPTSPTVVDCDSRQLEKFFVAWKNYTRQMHSFHTCLRVCTRATRKSVLEHAFFKWKCETAVSLADRKSSHAERLHFVVEDYESKQLIFNQEMRNLRRERDLALNRVDRIMSDSKLALHKAQDLCNGMVIDFRKPIFALGMVQKDPLASGCITFERATVVPPVAPTLCLGEQYFYDCGNEFPVEGMGVPNSEAFRSFYRINVMDTTVPPRPRDSLLEWVNDEVLEFCFTDVLYPNHPTKFVLSDIGEMGAAIQSFIEESERNRDSWNASVTEAKHGKVGTGSNICLATSSTLRGKQTLSCHLRRASEIRSFPFLYVVLLYRLCPRLFLNFRRSTAKLDSVEGYVSVLLSSKLQMQDVIPFLHAIGVLQRVSTSMLTEDAVGACCEASHRLVLSRLNSYKILRPEFEQLLKVTMPPTMPQKRTVSLRDMINMRDGEFHRADGLAAEVLEWVRSVLEAPPTAPVEAANIKSIDNVSESFGEGLELVELLVKRLCRQRGISMATSLGEEAELSQIETSALRLCQTAVSMGCHMPRVVFNKLHFDQPSVKLLFLTSLFNKFGTDEANDSISEPSKNSSSLPSTTTSLLRSRHLSEVPMDVAQKIVELAALHNDPIFRAFIKYATFDHALAQTGCAAISMLSAEVFLRDLVCSLCQSTTEIVKLANDQEALSTVRSLSSRSLSILKPEDELIVRQGEMCEWLVIVTRCLPETVLNRRSQPFHLAVERIFATITGWSTRPRIPALALVDPMMCIRNASDQCVGVLQEKTKSLGLVFSRLVTPQVEVRWSAADEGRLNLSSFVNFCSEALLRVPQDSIESPLTEFFSAVCNALRIPSSKNKSLRRKGSPTKPLRVGKKVEPVVNPIDLISFEEHVIQFNDHNAAVAFILVASMNGGHLSPATVDFTGFTQLIALLASISGSPCCSLPLRCAALVKRMEVWLTIE